jgi:hypothetical protein
MDTSVIVHIVANEVCTEFDVNFSQHTQNEISKMLSEGLRRGTFRTTRDVAVVAATLYVAGMQEAVESNEENEGEKLEIDFEDIDKAWGTKLRTCPGNMPIYLCARRSILERERELRQHMKNLNSVIISLPKQITSEEPAGNVFAGADSE